MASSSPSPHFYSSWFVESVLGFLVLPPTSDKNRDINIVVIWWTTSKSTFEYLNPSGGWLRNYEFNKSRVAE